jgi:hypothetical protein
MQTKLQSVAISDEEMLQRLDTLQEIREILHVEQADVEGRRWTPGWVQDNGCIHFVFCNGMDGRSCTAGEGRCRSQQAG